MNASTSVCPVCGSDKTEQLLEIPNLPLFCNIQLDSAESAAAQPTGRMQLDYCAACSHFYNSAFDESALAYSESYENSLHFSATFSQFAEGLARRLVERFGLQEKKILDIGCGKGDFLALICELGANTGFGFDKSYEEGRAKVPGKGTVRYFRDFFSKEYAYLAPDLITCRHVLEHIPKPLPFLDEILSAAGASGECAVYIEVPNALYTVRDKGIWDLIYEHCHYFTPRSLRTALTRSGVAVDNIEECFGGQFIGLEGVTGAGVSADAPGVIAPDEEVARMARHFASDFSALLDKWQRELLALDGETVVWGAGSKGVTFMNLIPAADRIAAVVDINPHKQGKYAPVSAHHIVGPEALREIAPANILVMNPQYQAEIGDMVAELGLEARLLAVD